MQQMYDAAITHLARAFLHPQAAPASSHLELMTRYNALHEESMQSVWHFRAKLASRQGVPQAKIHVSRYWQQGTGS